MRCWQAKDPEARRRREKESFSDENGLAALPPAARERQAFPARM
jgi:hypothetical protein